MPCQEECVKGMVAAALAASLATCLALAGTGLVLLTVPGSGARGPGAALVLAGLVSLTASLALAGPRGLVLPPILGAAAALAAALPVVGLAWALLSLSGLAGGAASNLGLAMVVAAILLALGAAAILWLGFRRLAAPTRLRPPAAVRVEDGLGEDALGEAKVRPAETPDEIERLAASLQAEAGRGFRGETERGRAG
jgi:hypothetical protein